MSLQGATGHSRASRRVAGRACRFRSCPTTMTWLGAGRPIPPGSLCRFLRCLGGHRSAHRTFFQGQGRKRRDIRLGGRLLQVEGGRRLSPPRDVSSRWPWAGMTPGPSWTPSRIRLPGVAMGTHFSAVSGTGLARYRHGRLREGGAESRPVGATESGLSNAACRGPGAAGEGVPSTPSRRAAPPPLSPPST